MRGIGNKWRGMTVANNYWSATTNNARDPRVAWDVYFNDGSVTDDFKLAQLAVRAVRTGL